MSGKIRKEKEIYTSPNVASFSIFLVLCFGVIYTILVAYNLPIANKHKFITKIEFANTIL